MAGPIASLLAWAGTRPDLPPVGYRIRRIDWVLDLGRGGASITPYGQTDAVPTMRRSGPRPMPLLAVDTAAYVIGAHQGKGVTAEQASNRAASFWSQIAQWASCCEHPAVGATLALAHMHGAVRSPRQVPPGDRVAVRVEGVWLHRLPDAVDHWLKALVAAKGGPTGLCIGCGRARPLATSLPNAVPAHLVPGAEHEVQLAVLPLPERVGGHLPVCVPCGDRASMALQALLEDRTRSRRFAGQDSVTTVFGLGPAGSDDAVVAMCQELGI